MKKCRHFEIYQFSTPNNMRRQGSQHVLPIHSAKRITRPAVLYQEWLCPFCSLFLFHVPFIPMSIYHTFEPFEVCRNSSAGDIRHLFRCILSLSPIYFVGNIRQRDHFGKGSASNLRRIHVPLHCRQFDSWSIRFPAVLDAIYPLRLWNICSMPLNKTCFISRSRSICLFLSHSV